MIARLLVQLIRVYQRFVSPMIGPVCRFEPSCSRYAAACLETHGALRGGLLSVVRVCKCHPFHPGGWDPPPPARPRATPPPLASGRAAAQPEGAEPPPPGA